MPHYAFLQHDLACSCDALVSDTVYFSWGLCDNRRRTDATSYVLEEAIKWRQGGNGAMAACAARVYFSDGAANIGDPDCQDLIVTFINDGAGRGYFCRGCHIPFAGSAVCIHEGRIVDA